MKAVNETEERHHQHLQRRGSTHTCAFTTQQLAHMRKAAVGSEKASTTLELRHLLMKTYVYRVLCRAFFFLNLFRVFRGRVWRLWQGAGAAAGGGGGLESQDPKLQYLKNLMLKYLGTDEGEAREHMERAIATVLQFSEEVRVFGVQFFSGSLSLFTCLFAPSVSSTEGRQRRRLVLSPVMSAVGVAQ